MAKTVIKRELSPKLTDDFQVIHSCWLPDLWFWNANEIKTNNRIKIDMEEETKTNLKIDIFFAIIICRKAVAEIENVA